MKFAIRLALLTCLIVTTGFFSALFAQSSPQIEFNAEKAAPRSVEDLTSHSIPRDYGFAWQNMTEALDDNHANLLNSYFTGTAKTNLAQRVEQQTSAGLHTHYTDHGHKLTVLFYSPNGDAMQLQDDAELEVEILDGSKVIHSEPLHVRYMVLMTPGADRWMVRDMVAVPANSRD